MALHIIVNGQEQALASLSDDAPLASVLTALELASDRVAVEQNGVIIPRRQWAVQTVRDGDRLEVVHFVGGG